MDGLDFTDLKGNDGFIPYAAIDRITIEPNTEWTYLEKNWRQKIFGGHYENVETGKWNFDIETVGGKHGRIIFDDKESAIARLEEIKSAHPVDIVINKLTVKERNTAWVPTEGEPVLHCTRGVTGIAEAGVYSNGLIWQEKQSFVYIPELVKPFKAESVGKPWGEI